MTQSSQAIEHEAGKHAITCNLFQQAPSPSFRDKLIFSLFLLVSGGTGLGSAYYPCQRLGA